MMMMNNASSWMCFYENERCQRYDRRRERHQVKICSVGGDAPSLVSPFRRPFVCHPKKGERWNMSMCKGKPNARVY